MKIDSIKKSDCAELAALDRVCFAVPWSEKSFFEETENPNARYFIARDENKIVGYCGFWRVADEGQVMNIAVLPEYRRRGIAAMLIECMINAAENLEQLVLEVRESNIGAIRLYEKFGFEVAGRRKKFYHSPEEDGLVMIRR